LGLVSICFLRIFELAEPESVSPPADGLVSVPLADGLVSVPPADGLVSVSFGLLGSVFPAGGAFAG
jgi:hypothetical protein